MYQFGCLIFTGKGTGTAGREVKKATGDNYFYLGRLNADRTVATAIELLCRRQKQCTGFDVYQRIREDTGKLKTSGKFPREFPYPDAEYEYLSYADVERHIRSVLKRSLDPTSKFIPHNIRREGSYIFQLPAMRIVP